MNSERQIDAPAAGPSASWLAAGLLLSGMGTVLLGPILPALSQQWHLPDYQAGLLLFAKFIGAFVGGSTVSKRLRNAIFFGLMATCIGLSTFAFSFGLISASLSLFVTGIGLGQLIASTNILIGRRYSQHTGSAVTFMNFFWSLGAVAVGALVAALLPHHTLRQFLLSFAVAFIVIALGGRLRSIYPAPAAALTNEPESYPLAKRVAISFGIMLFLYGGLETCLSQWITTYTVRYTGGHVLGGQTAIVVLWTALTLGRALTSLLMRNIRESTVQRGGLLCSVIMIPIIANCNSAKSVSIACVLLGLSLAPVFPVTFALLLRRRPPARQAGFILAVSGIGAALLTWLMGIISTQVGSLRVAMVVPFLAAAGLLALSFWMPCPDASTVPLSGLPPTEFPEPSKASR